LKLTNVNALQQKNENNNHVQKQHHHQDQRSIRCITMMYTPHSHVIHSIDVRILVWVAVL
jgi:hypothetical protein